MSNRTRSFFLLIVAVFTSLPILAQDIEVNWPAKKLLNYPSEINSSTTVRITVRQVNDLLYDYKTDLARTPVASDGDLDALLGTISGVASKNARVPDATCDLQEATQKELDALWDALGNIYGLNPYISNDKKNTKAAGVKPLSISLQDTRGAWNQFAAGHLSTLLANLHSMSSLPACTNAVASIEHAYKAHVLKPRLDRIYARLESSHELYDAKVLVPDSSYTLTVTEYFFEEEDPKDASKGQTQDGSKQFTFAPQSHTLTISGGLMLSGIQSRSYTAAKVPDTSIIPPGTQTLPVLSVGGTGKLRPTAVGLLNYHLFDFGRLGWRDGGVALSSGLVLNGSGSSDLSSFGYFGGVSFYLYHRLFITPGVHVGEFADFPQGFVAGQQIPSDFGSLTPVKRWTTRFGIAITYRAKSLGSARVTKSESSNGPSSNP